MANLLQTPEPHYIPGYTGYCPQYMYRTGDSYASATHKILLDPKIHKSGKLVLSDRTVSDFQVISYDEHIPRKLKTQVNIRNESSPYKNPMVPGYSGAAPGSGSVGKRLSIDAIEGKQEFDKQNLKKRASFVPIIEEQTNEDVDIVGERPMYENIENVTLLSDKNETKTYSLPLLEVRPEYSNVLRNITIPEPAPSPCSYYTPVDKMMRELSVPAHSTHVPFGHAKYGESNKRYETGVPNDFTTNYRLRQSTEWAPVNVIKAEPPLIISSAEIYHKHMGMVPNYTGHIPGQAFRSGRTYGTDTRDAKRWIRGDHTD